jgi:hypothetical protein
MSPSTFHTQIYPADTVRLKSTLAIRLYLLRIFASTNTELCLLYHPQSNKTCTCISEQRLRLCHRVLQPGCAAETIPTMTTTLSPHLFRRDAGIFRRFLISRFQTVLKLVWNAAPQNDIRKSIIYTGKAWGQIPRGGSPLRCTYQREKTVRTPNVPFPASSRQRISSLLWMLWNRTRCTICNVKTRNKLVFCAILPSAKVHGWGKSCAPTYRILATLNLVDSLPRQERQSALTECRLVSVKRRKSSCSKRSVTPRADTSAMKPFQYSSKKRERCLRLATNLFKGHC